MSDTELTLSQQQLEGLHVLSMGMASRSVRTVTDKDKGLHGINGGIANALIDLGLAREVKQWNSVEITDEGRRFLMGRLS